MNPPIRLPNNPIRFAWWSTKGQRHILALCWLVVITATLLVRVEFYVLGELVDAATAYGKGSVGEAVLWQWMWILMGAYLIGETLWRTSGFTAQRWMTTACAKVYDGLFQYLTGHSTRYFHERFAGAITNKISNAVQGVQGLSQITTWQFIPLVLGVTADVYLLYRAHAIFGVILSIWFVVFLTANLLRVRKLRSLSYAHAEASSKLKGKLVDTTTNIESVHQQASERYEHGYVRRFIQEEKAAHRRGWYMFEWILIMSGGLLFILIATVISLAIYFLTKGLMTVGTLVMIITIMYHLEKNLFFLGEQLSRAMQLYGQIEEGLTEILEPHEIVNETKAENLSVKSGEIVYSDIVFSYGSENIFNNFSIQIPSGGKLGLVGPSGAGKSTFVNLLLRLYDVESGQIKIDGQDIKEVSLTSLRQQIALVPQSSSLFHRTIADNIRYGRLGATDEEVREAAKLALAHEFIDRLADGYDTYVGERGVKLSGGQRQRISIARAILKNAPILVLDEATSALDSESEALIQEALATLMKGRTTIAIAHRLSTLKKMDRIVVLDNGVIVEDGTHGELVGQDGLYSALWNRQVGGFLGDETTL